MRHLCLNTSDFFLLPWLVRTRAASEDLVEDEKLVTHMYSYVGEK